MNGKALPPPGAAGPGPAQVLGRPAPLVIAEISANHNQSLSRALELVEAAAETGADGIKLQTYTPDSMTLDLATGDFVIDDPQSPWHGWTLYQLYQKGQTPAEWHAPLFCRARELGLLAFSTPFDEAAVDFLQQFDPPAFKIASFELVDLPLIEKAAATGKPLILSTGMATLAEIAEAVSAARSAGCSELYLLKCTSSYPAPASMSNLLTLPHLAAAFGCPVGLSDHTPGIGVAAAAVALGAVIIEKHLTLSRADGGIDAAFSLEPAEMRQLVQEARRAREALGGVWYGPTPAEEGARRLRRSLYIVDDVHAGQRLTGRHVRAIRPGGGLPPKYRAAVIGRRVRRSVPKGTPLTWDLLD